MDTKTVLAQLGEPDPAAVERVWTRFQVGRRPRRGRWPLRVAAAAVVAAWVAWPQAERAVALDGSTVAWSDEVSIAAEGQGVVTGTSRDLVIAWDAGRIRAEVTPHTGTSLVVRTEEAEVVVVGTVFTVDRDRLGSTVEVERGRVLVRCRDGWAAEVGPDDPPLTCLPVSAAGLLGRADALVDAGGPPDAVLETLDRGVAAVRDDGPVLDELLVRRMRLHAEAGRVDAALADAERYLAHRSAARTLEVQRFAAWLTLDAYGCEAAVDRLTALHQAGSAEETVLLAECIAEREPETARSMLLGALAMLDGEWSDRAVHDLSALSRGTR